MGSSFSIQSRDKRRRSNRLSKPPSNITTLSTINCGSSQPLSSSSSPASSNPAEWQNPWTGAVIPINSPDAESSGRRSQSFPSASLYPEGPWVAAHRVGRSQSIVKDKRETDSRSPTTSSSTSGSLSRKTSVRPCNPTATWSEPQSPLAPPARPRRSYSVQSPPPRANGTRYSSTIEDATSSNTHFMVDSQGFSLIRRRSLLTRPGIATRRSSKNVVRRLPSPIDQEAGFSSTEPVDQLQNSSWPLPDPVDSSHPNPLSLPSLRPPTPNDFEYTHLGALKLGSLRVVNCSTSPCPSDRTRLNQARSPSPIPSERQLYNTEPWHLRREFRTLGGNMAGTKPSDDFELVRHNPPSEVGLIGLSDRYAGYDPLGAHQHEGTAEPAGRQPDDLLHSFSHDFKKEDDGLVGLDPHAVPSNTAITQRHPSKEAEDEGILISDEGDLHPGLERSISTQWDSQHSKSSKSSRSHKKVDSGYSSAASVRSMQDARVRVSMDSQSSAHHSPGNRRFTLHAESAGRGLSGVKPQAELNNQLPIHRHLSLQGPKSAPKPDLGTWPTDLSTMCHENPQAPVTSRLRSSSYTPQISSRPLSLPRYCAQLRSLEGVPVEPLPSSRLPGTSKGTSSHSIYRNPSLGRPSRSTADGAVQPNFSNKTDGNEDLNGSFLPGMAGRGHSKAVGIRKHKSISRPGSTGEVLNTSVNLEPLSAKEFPGMGADGLPPRHKWPFEPATNEEIDPSGCPAESRGRTRSRSIDYHRRRLSKPQQGPNIYTAASPFIFH